MEYFGHCNENTHRPLRILLEKWFVDFVDESSVIYLHFTVLKTSMNILFYDVLSRVLI